MLQGSSLGRFWTVRKCIFNTWQESSLIRSKGSCLYAQSDCLQYSHSLCLPFPLHTDALSQRNVAKKDTWMLPSPSGMTLCNNLKSRLQRVVQCCLLRIVFQINALSRVGFLRLQLSDRLCSRNRSRWGFPPRHDLSSGKVMPRQFLSHCLKPDTKHEPGFRTQIAIGVIRRTIRNQQAGWNEINNSKLLWPI